MHPVSITANDVSLLKAAREKHDWKMLPTARLRYIYQRMVCLPENDIKTLQEISGVDHVKRYARFK